MSEEKALTPTFDRGTKEERDYWVGRLSGLTETAGLRPDFKRPNVYSGERARLTVEASGELLRKMSKVTSGSPFLTYAAVAAAVNVCLRRYTRLGQITIGSPARLKEGEATPPVNALPIVNEVDGSTPFKQLLLQVRESLIEAYARQGLPFERVVKSAGIEATENRCPLFDVAVAMRGLHGELPAVKNDLTLRLDARADALSVEAEYNPDLFRPESIAVFVRHLLSVLDSAFENVATSVDELEMTSPGEQEQLLRGFNDAAATSPATAAEVACVQHLFEAQAARTPGAPALVFDGEILSYKELDGRANQLAHHLRGLGVRPETRVAVCAERSTELIVAVLAVLKAGGAYVPVDPLYPHERISYILRDAGASVLLTQRKLLPELPAYDGRAVCLDDPLPSHAGNADAPPTDGAGASNLAYVIYTSGSTGKPKGVMVEHLGLCNLVAAQIAAFEIRPESRVMQFASFSFDASVSEIFTALAAGAALHLGARETLLNDFGFVEQLRKEEISVITLPPAVLSALDAEELPALRTLVSAGENCPPEVVAGWGQGRRFINAYGPTEATVCATWGVCEPDDRSEPTIGRPLANAQVYVLDENLQPAPLNTPAEIYIGGVGVARGYLNQPALTAARFIPDPYAAAPGSRLYRTGDMARYLADGRLEFLGRKDEQVKVRGYRIELGEVEAALRAAPGVRDCAVAAREDGTGGRTLVAYFVGGGEGAILRERMAETLPGYMVPSAFVKLEALPLTPNGKLDRRALPAPDRAARAERKGEFVAARTPIEQKLVEIWVELLGVEKIGVQDNLLVGIHDHFFDMGGHSLLAVCVFSRIREVFGVDLPLRLIFTSAPTVAGLAAEIERYMFEQASVSEIASMLKEMDELSDDDIQALLESESDLS
ncbi:MAG TPA: amino acid adenylation domain-containing protein, partial [Pyrinomonadaceae bacterium]|nr:amino acid adenylation domain-containing protein [Pyrinomonadaceae bacterium]